MADEQYDKLELVGYHEPDVSMEQDANGIKRPVDLPGMYSVGVHVGGRFLTLAHFKAGNLVNDDNTVEPNKAPESPPSE